MKILLVNVHSSANAGDAVLNQASVDQLLDAYPHAAVTYAMNDPDSHDPETETAAAVGSFTYWVKAQNRDDASWDIVALCLLLISSVWFLGRYRLSSERAIKTVANKSGWHGLLYAYAEADMVVSCAGNFLYSSGRIGLPFRLHIFAILFASWLGKPLYMMPQTIGPLERPWEVRLVKRVLAKIPLVFVRDELTQRLLQDRVGNKRAQLVPDIAFAFPKAAPEAGLRLLADYGLNADLVKRPLLGVTLINWGAQNSRFQQQAQYERAVANAIQAFVSHTGGQAVLFSQVQGPKINDDDRVPAGRVYDLLPDLHDRLIYIDRVVDPQTLKSAYGLMDLFVGSRLHSNIFALSQHVPVVAIQYQFKTRGIMRMLDMEQWVIEIENVDNGRLVQLAMNAWDALDSMQAKVNAEVPMIVTQASTLGRQIKQAHSWLGQQ